MTEIVLKLNPFGIMWGFFSYETTIWGHVTNRLFLVATQIKWKVQIFLGRFGKGKQKFWGIGTQLEDDRPDTSTHSLKLTECEPLKHRWQVGRLCPEPFLGPFGPIFRYFC